MVWETAAIIGLVAGLFGAFTGIAAIIYALGYFEYLMLDESRRAARYCEEMGSVRWLAGADGTLKPQVHFEKSYFRGRILFQKSWEVQYGIKEDGTLGKVYEYKFDVNRVRDPIKKAIKESGWEFVPVVRKEHATYERIKTEK